MEPNKQVKAITNDNKLIMTQLEVCSGNYNICMMLVEEKSFTANIFI